MPPQIPRKARVLLGSVTVVMFTALAIGLYPTLPVVTPVLGLLAAFRLYVLIKQIRRGR